MRLQLLSKDCVRFGLMKGRECVLEHIVFSDKKTLPMEVIAGEIHIQEDMVMHRTAETTEGTLDIERQV